MLATCDPPLGLGTNAESTPQWHFYSWQHPAVQQCGVHHFIATPLSGHAGENILRTDPYQTVTPHCYCWKCSQHIQSYTSLKQTRYMLGVSALKYRNFKLKAILGSIHSKSLLHRAKHEPGVVVHTCNPGLQKQEMNSCTLGPIHRETLSQKHWTNKIPKMDQIWRLRAPH